VGAPQASLQGLAVGAGLVAASFGVNDPFATRSARLLLIDAGDARCSLGLQFGIAVWD
jgi:hypothetical protein